jgi:hypothetical protein
MILNKTMPEQKRTLSNDIFKKKNGQAYRPDRSSKRFFSVLAYLKWM